MDPIWLGDADGSRLYIKPTALMTKLYTYNTDKSVRSKDIGRTLDQDDILPLKWTR
jgi:hypothetical protein